MIVYYVCSLLSHDNVVSFKTLRMSVRVYQAHPVGHCLHTVMCSPRGKLALRGS